MTHSRSLSLSKVTSTQNDCDSACRNPSVLFCAFDTVVFNEDGDYSAGPVWHVHSVEGLATKPTTAVVAVGFPGASIAAPTTRFVLAVEAAVDIASTASTSELKLVPSTCYNKIPTPPPYFVNTTAVYATASGHFNSGETASFVSAFMLLPERCSCKEAPSATSVCGHRAFTTPNDNA